MNRLFEDVSRIARGALLVSARAAADRHAMLLVDVACRAADCIDTSAILMHNLAVCWLCLQLSVSGIIARRPGSAGTDSS